MAREIDRERLNYMSAYIKYYDDGSQILQSYNTDVVKRTLSGKYIRLWDGWSPSTMKQVKAYCGHYFRGLPFEDGHIEDTKPVYKRKGYRYDGRVKNMSLADIETNVSRFIRELKNKDYKWMVDHSYSTAMNKELRKNKAMQSQKRQRLLDALYSCGTKQVLKNSPISILAKMYNFDFETLWNNALIKDFGPMKNAN